MTQVVQPHILQTRPLADDLPVAVELDQPAPEALAHDHAVRTLGLRYPRQHCLHWARHRHHAGSCLGIAQPQHARRAVDVVPPKLEDLRTTAPGKYQ